MTFKRNNSSTPTPELLSPRLTMKISSKLKPPSRNWTETSERSSSTNQENSLIQSTTKEEKREWPKDPKRDGTASTLFTLVSLPKNNKDTETISRLILRTTEKTKESKNFWTDKSFWETTSTVSTSSTSKKATPSHRRTIKPHILKRRSLSSSTEELWIQEPSTKEETPEWSKTKDPDSKKENSPNWFKTI